MDALHVRVVKELITLGPLAEGAAAPVAEAGKHLAPSEFHDALLAEQPSQAVILDARNLYEHRIGHFKVRIDESFMVALIGTSSGNVFLRFCMACVTFV